ncbi:MAG: sigma-70 family RNA polymerase sigma factor [Candidatus Rokubacteria bacterium]|nr:sigma-70 family RNA polymerase sigma factor [Candidatus Rokubacteria bacterium]
MAERDDRAFDLLVSRYQARAYRIAWSIVRDADEARDLSQDAFLRLYERAGRFEGRARFSTWFYRLLVNVCLDHRRRHRWWRSVLGGGGNEPDAPPALDQHPASEPGPDEDAARKQTMTRIWAELERLSPQQRAAVRLQLEGLPTAEIAEVLDCSEATARVHLHRALATLRKTVGTR